MAGGTVKYRHLSRDSAARQALLRGLVTQLVKHEHLHTTYAKAKEAQRMAEKLITLAKRDNEPCRRSAQAMLYTPDKLLPKLLGELKARYATREGGYTRVVRTEPKNTYDQGESAILELVDGPKDSRFMMTAKTVARDRALGRATTAVTGLNVKKVTQFRGVEEFEKMVERFMAMDSTVQGRVEAEDLEDGLEEEEYGYETEGRGMAQREAKAAETLGPAIVPDSVKTQSPRQTT
ncbi:ribosomal protein l17 domain-containing protein [Sarocladium implicatum]|nr:ribosomal protein l17 domain-containing protein [Sarocladium implicatum]